MNAPAIKNELLTERSKGKEIIKKKLFDSNQLEIYSKSIFDRNGILFFVAKQNTNKHLYLLFDKKHDETITASFEGKQFKVEGTESSFIKRCELNTVNRKSLQQHFEFTLPKTLGLVNSFGFGDRVGLANAAHI